MSLLASALKFSIFVGIVTTLTASCKTSDGNPQLRSSTLESVTVAAQIAWTQNTMLALRNSGLFCLGSNLGLSCQADSMICGVSKRNQEIGCSFLKDGRWETGAESLDNQTAQDDVYSAIKGVAQKAGVLGTETNFYTAAFQVNDILITLSPGENSFKGKNAMLVSKASEPELVVTPTAKAPVDVQIEWKQETMSAISKIGMMCVGGGFGISCSTDTLICGVIKGTNNIGCSYSRDGRWEQCIEQANGQGSQAALYRAIKGVAEKASIQGIETTNYSQAYQVKDIAITMDRGTNSFKSWKNSILVAIPD